MLRQAARSLAAAARRASPQAAESTAAWCALPSVAAQTTPRGRMQLSRAVSSSLSHGFASTAAQAEAAAAGPAATPSSTPSAAAAEALPPVYSRLPDRVEGAYTVPAKAVFAVVELGGTQYKVTPDDVVVCEKLSGLDVNDKLRLDRVLLLGSRDETVIGRPYVPGAHVVAAVEEQFLDGKVLIFHKRRRKNSRRLRGHRQPLTTIRILEVHGVEEAAQPAAASEA